MSAEAEGLPEAPAEAWTKEGYHFGRYRTPIAEPVFPISPLRSLRKKEWHYTSIATDRFFVAFGMVQLRYIANIFVYLVDREHPDPPALYERLAPLGVGLSMAKSSIDGKTRFHHKDDRIEIAYEDGYRMRLDVGLDGGPGPGRLKILGGFTLGDSLALLHPLSPERPAYTHKAAGMRCHGTLSFRDHRIDLKDALATLDWTRSMANRHTTWRWASLAGRALSGREVGLNLSADVYDDAEGVSRENAAWIDGKVQTLGEVRFEMPTEPCCEDWRLFSPADDSVDLSFQPLGARHADIDYRLVSSRFVQPYGLFNGRVAGEQLRDVFGVVEDHDAHW